MSALNLRILYEDKDVLVVDKPAGLLTHPARPNGSELTVVDFARSHGVDDKDNDRPGIVHRLDKDTSGALVIAKNQMAKADLQSQFKKRTVGKVYLALVQGHLRHPRAVIKLPIGRHRSRMTKRAVVGGARASVTEYKVLQQLPDSSLVEIRLRTGRTHQIRVHFAQLGHPIVGDVEYGRSKQPASLKRQFLHAAELEFKSPDGSNVKVSSPLPADLSSYLKSQGSI